MHASLQIVLILTVGLALASLLAFIAQRLRLPAILGYLLAGFAIGPYSPGFVADVALSEQLAEVGVILMLFGVGLHFRIEDLLDVKKIAIPGAVAQTFFAALFGFLVVTGIGWSTEAGLVIGLSIGVASTVVLVKILEDNGILNTKKGHIAVGWLVVEDLFTVVILILMPTIAMLFSGTEVSLVNLSSILLFLALKFAVLGLFMFQWGHKIVGYILTNVARLRFPEHFTLTVLALVFLIATGSAVVFGTSIALGAFIAGMVVGKTNVRYQAAANALPFKDIFAVVFFISVGTLFNPHAIAENPLLFCGILGVILIVKPIVAFMITLALGHSLNVALTIAVALAQIGEFSFILAEEALQLELLPDAGYDLLVACALVSISLNPIFFRAINKMEKVLSRLPILRSSSRIDKRTQEKLKTTMNKVVVVGFGPIGREVCAILKQLGINPIIIEQNIDTVASLEAQDTIFFGDATDSHILQDIHIEEASHLLITVPHTEKSVQIIHAAQTVNPAIQVVCRSEFIREETPFKELHVHSICTEQAALQAFAHLVRTLFPPRKIP